MKRWFHIEAVHGSSAGAGASSVRSSSCEAIPRYSMKPSRRRNKAELEEEDVVDGSTQLVAVRQARASRQNATSADAMARALGREWGLYRQPLGLERRRAGDPVWWRAGETACGGSMQENRTASGGVSYARRAGELGRRRAAHGEPRRRRVARGEPGRRRAARRKRVWRRRGSWGLRVSCAERGQVGFCRNQTRDAFWSGGSDGSNG
jgi:hypothetical protein